MIKLSYIVLLCCLMACGQQSSPDGRSRSRDANLQLQIDSLKMQQTALMDSIAALSRKMDAKH